MANKRIKISELPKVTYDPTADIFLTKTDYLPISVTNKLDLTVKTTMAVTTRELQRFTLQQQADHEDVDGELTIGNSGVTVKINRVNVSDNLTVSGECIFTGGVTMSSITLDSGIFNRDIQVGGSIYPSRLISSSGSPIPYGLLVANTNGYINQTNASGMSLSSLIALAPVTVPAHSGRVATVDSQGRLNFSLGIGGLIGGTGGLTTNPDEYYNVVTIGNDGGLASNSGVKVSTLQSVVGAVTGSLSENSDTSSVTQRFITSTSTSPTLQDVDYHSTITVKKVSDSIDLIDNPFGDTVNNNNRILVSRASTPSLDDVQVAPADSMLINTSVNATYDAADFIDPTGSVSNRVIFKAPIVLGAKHPDDVDLTDQTTNYQSTLGVKGCKNFPAQVGEIRWNFYNGVPTLYLAVRKMSGVSGQVDGACVWYGTPLFGTIDMDTGYDPATGFIDDTTKNKHSYEDLD